MTKTPTTTEELTTLSRDLRKQLDAARIEIANHTHTEEQYRRQIAKLREGFRQILESNDSEMRDGDLAREIAERLLEDGTYGDIV